MQILKYMAAGFLALVLLGTSASSIKLATMDQTEPAWTASDAEIVKYASTHLVISAQNNGVELARAPQFNAIYHVPNSTEVRVNFTIRLSNQAAGQVSVVLHKMDYVISDIRAARSADLVPAGP